MTDELTRPLVEERLDLEDQVAAATNALKEATECISSVNQYPYLQSSMQVTFMLARDHGAFVSHAVRVTSITLEHTGLEGMKSKRACSNDLHRPSLNDEAFALPS